MSHFQRGNMDDSRAREVGARWSLQSHYNKFEVGEYDDRFRWSPPGERYGTAPLVRFDTTHSKLVFDPSIRTLRVDQSAMQWVDAAPVGGDAHAIRGRDIVAGSKFDLAIKPVGIPVPTMAPLVRGSSGGSGGGGGGGGGGSAVGNGPVSHF